MTTTNIDTVGAEDRSSHMAGVTSLEALRRAKRLNGLEATRSHLGAVSAQQRSHGSEDAEETLAMQLAVEATIAEEFPEAYAAMYPECIARDLAAEHPTGIMTVGCGICRMVAKTAGINLTPPEAA